MKWYILDLIDEGVQSSQNNYLKYKTVMYSDTQEQIIIEPISDFS